MYSNKTTLNFLMPVSSSSLRPQGVGDLDPEDIESQTLNVYGILYADLCANCV